MRVLVAEDEDMIRDVIADILETHGHEVMQAESGERALQLCAEAAPELLFTDIRLGGSLSGWDVAIQCREANPGIPVIYATGYNQAVPRPVSGSIMLQKPFSLERLLEAMKSLTRK
ncbi:response regulator [Bradyrhizobium sp. 195]|uniref:response regulator n=1 Tax=Bradyrhizobium sp. 195 TaxID=2782662 RepID=UPI0020015143|nr:response regulator [Bradyrhizobium sp. 195]UPK31159.1 response regulator [Bradyrhizobium sp. 195]